LKIINKKRIQITFWKCCAIAGASTATIGLLNAFSAVAGKVMTVVGISNFLSTLITSNISSKWGFLLLINILFLFMGTFMDINATILIMTPLLLPVAQTYGITPVHFGTIMIVNMCVGFLTPPFAVGIFVSTKIADSTFGETVKEAIPFILVGLIAILVTTLCPGYINMFVHLFG
ncbi:MAG: TRAP transporter large permease subunit, partial [Otoolea sp.]